MSLTVLSPGSLYMVEQGGLKFQVAMLPGAVAVYGDMGKQSFSNPLSLPPGRLKEIFVNDAAIRRAANLETISSVDMRKLMASVEKAFNAKLLTSDQLRGLQDLLSRCDCTPEGMKHKVVEAGYSRILHLLAIEDHNPALDATVNAMQIFLKEFK